MSTQASSLREQVIDYIAAWVAYHVGQPTGEITLHEMQEFLYQHGYELTPPDEETTFTARDYWQAVIEVARRRLRNPDRVVGVAWKP
jgi:hypothetical protein